MMFIQFMNKTWWEPEIKPWPIRKYHPQIAADCATTVQWDMTRADLHACGDPGMVQNPRFRLKEYVPNHCDASG